VSTVANGFSSTGAAKALHAAAIAKGNSEFAAQWAGQGAPLAQEKPASSLVEELIREM
jgi:nitronate monooxygenase